MARVVAPSPEGHVKKLSGVVFTPVPEPHPVGITGCPEMGKGLYPPFCVTLSIGISKLVVLVRLKTSKV